MKKNFIQRFLQLQASSGILLMLAAVAAMVCANTVLEPYYRLLLSTPVEVRIGALEIAKPLLLWINDGLMAVFFFLVGLELKRELIEGELSSWRNVVLPGIGALGGMIVPAAVYLAFNYNDPVAAQGWAIPAATDIAFALGVLALLGTRVPVALKIFLTSLAIFDDIGAIVIIALFYTSKISLSALAVVLVSLVVLTLLNRMNVLSKSLYLGVGVVMWTAMLKSGVHATLAGVMLAFFIPIYADGDKQHSPLKELERDLHSLVAYSVLPIFAFTNAGIDFRGMSLDDALHPVPVGIALGLFIGKQLGVYGFCAFAIKKGWCAMPNGMNGRSLYGVSALCGIGFTMSLFIGSLAFELAGVDQVFDERLGILMGSLFSGVLGYLLLRTALPKQA